MTERKKEHKKYALITFGCQMNERDSETMAGMLEAMGYVAEADRQRADLLIINTCSVRENADNRFFGTLGQLKKCKAERPDCIIGVCGCMMQQPHIVEEIKRTYPWVDILFGTHNIHALPKLIERAVSEKASLAEIMADGGEIVEGLPAKRRHPFKAFITIMYGCDNYCAYCIVPYTRGRERSRKPEAILREARVLAVEGVKEITLLGQNVNSYRGAAKTGATVGFSELLYMLNEIDGVERIRFMTSHPKDLSDDLVAAFQTCGKLCAHIHLPVQAGSDRVLARMNRGYTKGEYLCLIDKLKSARPEIAVSTDIIVGFPGETEEDFNETLDLVNKAQFDSAFTFLYSARKGTPAERFEPQVPEAVKHERFNRLVELQNEISATKNKAYVGRIETVLAEGRSKADPDVLTGRTGTFKPVHFAADAAVAGQLVAVNITDAKTFSLFGELA